MVCRRRTVELNGQSGSTILLQFLWKPHAPGAMTLSSKRESGRRPRNSTCWPETKKKICPTPKSRQNKTTPLKQWRCADSSRGLRKWRARLQVCGPRPPRPGPVFPRPETLRPPVFVQLRSQPVGRSRPRAHPMDVAVGAFAVRPAVAAKPGPYPCQRHTDVSLVSTHSL